MPAAVTSFVSGAVPAVALWVPFNVTARDKVPGAIKLADASAYYPQAAIIDGWAAANDYYEPNKETLAKLIKGWAEANDYIVANSDGGDAGAAEGPLQPDADGRHQRVVQGAEDVHVAGMEEDVFGRHRHEVAAADRPTSSWPMPASRTSRRPASISIRACI